MFQLQNWLFHVACLQTTTTIWKSFSFSEGSYYNQLWSVQIQIMFIPTLNSIDNRLSLDASNKEIDSNPYYSIPGVIIFWC